MNMHINKHDSGGGHSDDDIDGFNDNNPEKCTKVRLQLQMHTYNRIEP